MHDVKSICAAAAPAVRYFAEQLTGELGHDPSVRTVANLVAQVCGGGGVLLTHVGVQAGERVDTHVVTHGRRPQPKQALCMLTRWFSVCVCVGKGGEETCSHTSSERRIRLPLPLLLFAGVDELQQQGHAGGRHAGGGV